MGLSSNVNAREAMANRARFLRKIGVQPLQLVQAQQVHGARVAEIAKVPRSGFILNTDALVTDKPNIFLGIRSADCFPVFFYDSAATVVAIAHAGWRGVVKGIVPKVVRVLRNRYKLRPQRIKVIIGPGIRKCHYEIWSKTRHRGILKMYRRFLHKRRKRLYADLEGAIMHQLKRSGVPSKNIRTVGECTYHMPRKYFSFRRDASVQHPRDFGNMVSVIGIKD